MNLNGDITINHIVKPNAINFNLRWFLPPIPGTSVRMVNGLWVCRITRVLFHPATKTSWEHGWFAKPCLLFASRPVLPLVTPTRILSGVELGLIRLPLLSAANFEIIKFWHTEMSHISSFHPRPSILNQHFLLIKPPCLPATYIAVQITHFCLFVSSRFAVFKTLCHSISPFLIRLCHPTLVKQRR